MELIDRATGQTVDVPDENAQAAFQSGQYGVAAGSRVPVTLADGRTGTVKAEQLHETLKGGARLATGQEWQEAQAAKAEAQLQAEHGTIGEMAKTAAEGAGRGLTFGLSDAALVALGADREAMEARKRANPWTAGVSEVAGAVAPMLIPGVGEVGAVAEGAELANAAKAAGTGAKALEGAEAAGAAARALGAGQKVAKAATVLPRGVDALGGLAERAAKAMVGEGSANVVARMAQKAVATGARGAVEGALYGAGNEVSDAVLSDHELTGQKLAAAMGHGALFGGMIGGAGGAAVEGLSTGAKALVKAAAPTAKAAAEDLAVKALNPTKAFEKAIEDLPGGKKALGRDLLDLGVVRPGDTVEHIAPRIDSAVERAGEQISSIAEKVDASGATVKHMPTVSELGEKMREAADVEFKGLKHSNSVHFNAIDNAIADMEAKFGGAEARPSLTDLRAFRLSLDSKAKFGEVGANGYTVARRTLEDEAERVLDKAAGDAGKDLLADYKSAKTIYSRLKVASKAVEDAVTRKGANSSIPLTSKLMGLHAFSALASGGLSVPLSAAKALATAYGGKLVQERGASTAAVLADKVAELGALSQTIKAVDARADAAISKFVEGKPAEYTSLKTASKAERDARFAAAAQRVKAAVRDPDQAVTHVQKALGGIVDHAPQVAAATAKAASRGAVYLASKMPKEPPPKTIQAQFSKFDPPTSEKEAFLRHVRAVDDPLSILDDLSRGRLTREGVEAVKEVYPSIYEQVHQLAMEKVTDAKKPLSYDQKVQLNLLLGVDTDETLKGPFIAAMQKTFAKDGGGNGGPPGKMPGPPKRPLEGFSGTSKLGRGRSDND